MHLGHTPQTPFNHSRRMPGIVKSEEVRRREKEKEEEGEEAEEGDRRPKDKATVLKDNEAREDMDDEVAREPFPRRSASPEAG